MNSDVKLKLKFWKTPAGNEPVREWLLELTAPDRKLVGDKMLTVQFRWPMGMPTVRKMEAGLWEVRVHVTDGKIARVLFTTFEYNMVLLHGFIKKSKNTPESDLNLARSRK